ncbi:MAG: ADP-ribosylglycohydrolase family protein [Luteolibacter sp.]
MDTFFHAALVADALSLGAHWVYDQEEIAEAFPHGVTVFSDPLTEYHKTKRAGDQTHYGDQTVMLRDSIEARGGFDADGWREDWLAAMEGYDGYVDGASRETMKTGGKVASSSSDLGGAARIAPILDLGLELDDAVAAARAETSLTHGDAAVADAAEFFTRAAYAVDAGAVFEDAMEAAAEEGSYAKLAVADHLEKARELRDENFPAVAEQLGQACGVDQAFPLALYFLLRPETDFEKTISDNALAGGDNAARAMLIALFFAAEDADVVEQWVEELRCV